MAESEAVAVLRTALRADLQQAFRSYEADHDDDFVVRRGSVRVFIRPLEQDERTLVRIWSITNVDVPVEGELTRFLATENARLALGKFNLNLNLNEGRSSVHFAHTLLGDFLNREELAVAVAAVAETADVYDDRIKERFGGRLFTDAPEILAGLLAAAEATTEAPDERTIAVQALFGFLAVTAAIGSAIYAYSVESSVWLSLFVAALALQLIGRSAADVITDPQKLRRALYFLLYPALATGILAASYAAWERWWLSVVLGLVGGVILNAILAPRLFPAIHRDEMLDSARRLIRQLRPAGRS